MRHLRLTETPEPEPVPGEVLRLRFAALHPVDPFLAQTLYPAKPSLPCRSRNSYEA